MRTFYNNALDEDHLLLDIKVRISESKYGSEPEVVAVQLYQPDDLDQKFGESGFVRCGDNLEDYIITKAVKIKKKKNKHFHRKGAK
jgi:hypothetical protein